MRSVLSVVAALGVLLLAVQAQAAVMVHHDLRSSFFMAQAVVRVVQLPRTRHDGVGLTRFRVMRSYQGTMVEGDTFEVTGLSNYRPGRSQGQVAHSEYVMFLVGRLGESGRWKLIPSGLRIRQSGRWMAFVQANNPGPYVPWPQGFESVVPPAPKVVRPGLLDSAFETELAAAKKAAAFIHETIRSGTGAELIALGRDVVRVPHAAAGFFENTAHEAIVKRLAELRRLGTRLDEAGRLGGYGATRLRLVPVDDIVLVALDSAAPAEHRIGALRVLATKRHGVPPQAIVPLLELLKVGDPRVRTAWLRASRILPSQEVQDAIQNAWKAEHDQMTRVEMLQRAAEMGFHARLAPPHALEVGAEIEREMLRLRYAARDPGWKLRESFVELLDASTRRRHRHTLPSTSPGAPRTWGGREMSLASLNLPAGRYDVEVATEFISPNGEVHGARVKAGQWAVFSSPTSRASATPPAPTTRVVGAPRPTEKLRSGESHLGCNVSYATGPPGLATHGLWTVPALLRLRRQNSKRTSKRLERRTGPDRLAPSLVIAIGLRIWRLATKLRATAERPPRPRA